MIEKEIKDHVKNVSDTIKITKAMQVIAATKIYSRQQQKDSAREYLQRAQQVAKAAMAYEKPSSRWFAPKKAKRTAYIVIAGDKGLCGDYNHVLVEAADEMICKAAGEVKVFAIGYIALERLQAAYDANGKYVHLQLNPSATDSWDMANELADEYLSGEFDELFVIYAESGKYGESSVECKKLLPIEYETAKKDVVHIEKVDANEIFRQYLAANIFYSLASASLAVNFKRMSAMRQATVNGEEMIDELKIQLNKTRQNKITNDLSDAVAIAFGKQL